MNTFIGVVLEGTRIVIAEITPEGNIMQSKTYLSAFFNQESALSMIVDSLHDFESSQGWKERPLAIGVGLIGRVDPVNGVWFQMDPDRSQAINFAEAISNEFHVPCFIDNDVKSATLAEQRWGCGRVSSDFVYINVGTGVGAGIVVGGKVIHGYHWDAGEVGYTSFKTGAGQDLYVEAVASGAGMDNLARKLRKEHATRLTFPTDRRIDVKEVFRLEQDGDALCHMIVEQATQALKTLIGNIARTIDPEYIVLGGGVVADGYLLKKMLPSLNGNSFRFIKDKIVITTLNGHETGLLGAAAMAMKGTEN